MTMPEKIWVDSEPNVTTHGEWAYRPDGGASPYIRKDLADELARALDGVRHYVEGTAGSDEWDLFVSSLARYRAATEEK